MDRPDRSTENKSTRKNIPERLRLISSDLQKYIEKRIELVHLEIADRLSLVMARSIHKLLGLAFMVFSYVFLMIALARYLGPLMGHPSLGYIIVAGLTGLLGLILASVKPAGFSKRMRRSWFEQVFAKRTSKSSANPPSQGQSKKENDQKETKESNVNKNQK